MRLSLKTILAYTDDLFDAEYLPVVKKRIGEEEAAGRLMERLHAVSRDPNLSVPGRSDDKAELSANLVAAYLDHRLSEAEQVQFEMICLRSDVFLAEVACTHRILTTCLGRPASLNRECRLQLYAMSRRNNQPAAVVDETKHDPDAPDESTDQSDITPIQAASDATDNITNDVTSDSDDHETVAPPDKKRRITVVSQGNVIAAPPSPDDAPVDASPQIVEAVEQNIEPEEKHGDIRFVADAVRNGEIPAERLAFYPANHESKSDAPATCVPQPDANSRLGEAFEHLKRRRRTMLASSAVLLLLLVSIFALSNRKPSSTGNDLAHEGDAARRSRATPVDPVQVDGERDNQQRFADNRAVWSPQEEIPSMPPFRGNVVPEADFSSYAGPTYSLNEPPDVMLQYLPGETPPQAGHPANQYANHASPAVTVGSVDDMRIASASGNLTFPSHAVPIPDQTAMISPAIGNQVTGPTYENIGQTAMSHGDSNDGNSPLYQADATSQNMSNNNGIGSTSWQLSMQSSMQQPDSGLVLQLIDRGSAQSVTQFMNHDLPAVRTATFETGHGPENPPANPGNRENNGNDPARQQTRLRDGGRFLSNDQASLPPYQVIEQVSYVAPREVAEPSPPLVEPNWNSTDHGGFEPVGNTTMNDPAMSDIPILQHGRMTAEQLATPRLPASRQVESRQSDARQADTRQTNIYQADNYAVLPPVMSPGNHVVTGVPHLAPENPNRVSNAASNTTSIANAFDGSAAEVRMPEQIARGNSRLNTLAPTRQPPREMIVAGEAEANSVAMLLGKEDIALVRDRPETEWSWHPVSKHLLPGAIVLVPAPFRVIFRFDNGMVVETEGDTRIRIMPPDETGRPAIAFDYGHVTVSAGGLSRLEQMEANAPSADGSRSLRIITPVGSGVLRLTDARSFVSIDSENRTSVKLLRVTRPYESVTHNPVFYTANVENSVIYCPNLAAFPAEGRSVFWRKDGGETEWDLPAASVFPLDTEKNVTPIIVYDTNGLIVAPAVAWPSLVSHDGNIPISKLDLKNQFVTMPHTFFPTPSKTWLLK